MTTVRFRLNISADRYLAYYQGSAHQVVATAQDGRRVRFPADRLRPFVTRDGVHGEFVLEFDANHKFVGLTRVGS